MRRKDEEFLLKFGDRWVLLRIGIKFLPKKDNWWGRPGKTGMRPDTEMFYWTGDLAGAKKLPTKESSTLSDKKVG